MEKLFLAFSTLLLIFTFNVNAAGSIATPVSGVVIEQDRGGVPGLEFPPRENATTIRNENQEFIAKGRLGSGGVDYFTFTMDTSFGITLDHFDFENDVPSNSDLSPEDITYKFILVDHSDKHVKISQENLSLFTDLEPGTYMLGITSPLKSAAVYDLTIAPSGFFSSLSLLAIGIGFILIIIIAGGLTYWKRSKG